MKVNGSVFKNASQLALRLPLEQTHGDICFNNSSKHRRRECAALRCLGPFEWFPADYRLRSLPPCPHCFDVDESHFRSHLFANFRAQFNEMARSPVIELLPADDEPNGSLVFSLLRKAVADVQLHGMTSSLYSAFENDLWPALLHPRLVLPPDACQFLSPPITLTTEFLLHSRLECVVAHCPDRPTIYKLSGKQLSKIRSWTKPCPVCTDVQDEQLVAKLTDGSLRDIFQSRKEMPRAPDSIDRRTLPKEAREAHHLPDETVSSRKNRTKKEKRKVDKIFDRVAAVNERRRRDAKKLRRQDLFQTLSDEDYRSFLTRLANGEAVPRDLHPTPFQTFASKLTTVWNDISSNVKRKGSVSDLTYAQYLWFIASNPECHWCGRDFRLLQAPVRLDRIDSDRGYATDNILPSCRDCNMTRGSLTRDEFSQACSDIVAHQNDRAFCPTHDNRATTTEKMTYGAWRASQIRSGKTVALKEAQWLALLASSCHYCGVPHAAGIDRVDSTVRSYTQDNCVACCKRCNFMKRDAKLDEFIGVVTLVYDRQRIARVD